MKKKTLFISVIFLMAVISSCQKDNNAAPVAGNAKTNNLDFASTALSSTGSQDPSVTIKNGLVGYYPFTGNMNDSSGNGNTAVPYTFVRVVSTPTFTTDKYGHPNSAYHFNGQSAPNFIEMNKNPLYFGHVGSYLFPVGASIRQFSIYLRFKTDSSGTLVYFGDQEFTKSKLKINTNRSVTFTFQSTLYVPNDPNGNTLQTTIDTVSGGPITYNPNKWVDVVVNYNLSCLILYLNGTLVGFNHTTMSSANIQNNFVIGATEGTFPLDFFKGSMDQVRLYDRALTNPEIAYLLAH